MTSIYNYKKLVYIFSYLKLTKAKINDKSIKQTKIKIK